MEKQWTFQQKKAIETRGSNLLVAAAAGSGKTAVLVERIIGLITDKEKVADIDKIMVVTFTNAAASEMRERIGKALTKKALENPESDFYKRQLALLNKANISTLHSFCQNLIKNNFNTLSLDPDFRVGDSTEVELLLKESLFEIMEERYEEKNLTEGFIKLIEGYGEKEDDLTVIDIIMKLYRFVMTLPWPMKFLNETLKYYEKYSIEDFKNSELTREIIDITKDNLKEHIKTIKDIIREIEEQDIENANLPILKSEESLIKEAIGSCNIGYVPLKESIERIEFKTLSRKKSTILEDTKLKIKEERDNYKKEINNLKEEFFSFSMEELKEDFLYQKDIIRTLKDIIEDLIDRYSIKKRKRNIIDFNDMEHFALKILYDDNGDYSKVARQLENNFAQIMVDEYQDSSLIQETIIDALIKKDDKVGNLFMVGDVKQSIYKFRGAKPELFLKKYGEYRDISTEEKIKSRKSKVLLFKNFRSRKEIIDGTNYIFEKIMSKKVGEIDYNEEERLNLGADYPLCDNEKSSLESPIEVIIFEDGTGNSEDEDKEEPLEKEGDTLEIEEDATNIDAEALIIGNRILELMGRKEGFSRKKVWSGEEGYYRDINYKDMVILLRSSRGKSEDLIEAFKKLDIPVYCDNDRGYFENVEVKTMVSLLKIIDNPKDDIPFLAVLMSPIGGFLPEELIDIKLNSDFGYFHDKLRLYAEEKNDSLSVKGEKFLQNLNIYREKSNSLSISELIWYLYQDTGYLSFVSTLAKGEQRKANLKLLFGRAKDYENTSIEGLYNFINFIENIKNSSGDLGDAKILSENDDVVRIMTIHKSKGLEFPVVFLANSSKKFNTQDAREKFIFHHKYGIAFELINYKNRLRHSTLMQNVFKNIIKRENYSEEERILYVALTRAREKLIITGKVKNIENAIKKYAKSLSEKNHKLSKGLLMRCSSYLDFIASALILHDDGKVFFKDNNLFLNRLNTCQDPSKWDIKLLNKDDTLAITNIKNESLKESKLHKYEEIISTMEKSEKTPWFEEIKKRLEYRYPYEEFSKVPSLLTVSEIKRRALTKDNGYKLYIPSLIKTPKFLQSEKSLSPAEKGTVLHKFMEYVNFYEDITIENLNMQRENLVKKNILSEEEASIIDVDKAYKFFTSDIGKLMLKSTKVSREYPFKIRVNAGEVMKEINISQSTSAKGEEIIVQGIIDVFFEINNEIVIVDYKSDYVTEDTIEDIKNKYKTQLSYYKRACEEITGKKVRNVYLYLFSINRAIEYK